jgi:serine/threonine-protein phosphatase 2B catalytic subunit
MEAQLIAAVTEKKPVPEIDFTLHTLEDDTQVSTRERVCKGNPIRRVHSAARNTTTNPRGMVV